MIKVRKILILLSFGITVLFISSLFSCGEDAGLGASVDTKAPGIEITYPPSDAIIRGSFVFGGTCSDDKGVSSVKVRVFRINSDDTTTQLKINGDSDTVNATVSGKKEWYVSLNEYDISNSSYHNGYQFLDGTYSVQATAYDKAGHDSGVVSRQFTIDNTPPVLIVTKPKTVGSETPASSNNSSFGRTVQLEGAISDSCASGISKLTVSFYDEEGNGILDSEFENITDMSNSNPLIIAQYYDESERNTEKFQSDDNKKKCWENFRKLYGEENLSAYENDGSAVTKKIYFTVTANDEAKNFTDFAGKTYSSIGNNTTIFNRGTARMLKLTAGTDSDFPNFTLLSLKQYFEGTDATYSSNESLAEILKEAECESTNVASTPSLDQSYLTNTSTENGKVYLSFSLNPENNPKYTVSGKEILTGTSNDQYNDGYVYYYPGSPVTVSMKPGLDKINIQTNSVSIYYAPVTIDTNGIETVDTANKKLFWTWNRAVALSYLESGKTETDLDAHPESFLYTETSESENTDELKISNSLTSENVKSGAKYKFIVEGHDTDGKEIISSKTSGFGLQAKSSVPIPEINLDEYVSTQKYKNLEPLFGFKKSVFDGTDAKGKFAFSGTVKSQDELVPSAMTYSVVLTDVENSGNKAEVKGPVEISQTYPAQQYEVPQDGEKWEYSWNFDFCGASDALQDVISDGSGLFTIGLSIYAGNGGGTSKIDRTYYLDTMPSEIINISLSAPEDSSYPAYEKSSGFFYLKNNAGTEFSLSGITTDNNKTGATRYKITYFDNGGNVHTTAESTENSTAGWSFSGISFDSYHAKSGSEYDALVTILTTDKAGNESSESIKVKYDTTPPQWKDEWSLDSKNYKFQIKNSEYSDSKWYKDTSLPVTAAFEENEAGLSVIYYWIQKPGDSVSTSNLSTADGSFNNFVSKNGISYFTNNLGSFDPSEVSESGGTKTITPDYLHFAAVDNAGNVSQVRTVPVNIDSEPPVLISNISGNQYTNKVSDISISGTYTENASGITKITIKLDNDNDNSVVGSWTLLENGDKYEGTWNATLSAGSDIIKNLSDGQHSVLATCFDTAENTNTSQIFTLNIDTESPEVSVTTPVPDSSSDVNLINGKKDFHGKVTYDDAQPNSFRLYYSTEKPVSTTKLSDLKPVGTELTNATDIFGWSVSGVNVESLSGVSGTGATLVPKKNLYIIPVVKDTAGNCNIYKDSPDGKRTYSYKEGKNYFVYTVDQNTDRPVITFANLENDENAWCKTRTLTGSVSDDDGIKSLEFSEDGGTSWNAATLADSNTTWTYTLSSEDVTSLCFRVTDTAGTPFTTGAESIFKRPYILYSGEKATDSAVTDFNNHNYTDYGRDSKNAVSIKVDTEEPKIEVLGMSAAKASDDIKTAADVSASSASYEIKESVFAGGTKKRYVKFFVPVCESHIAKVVLSLKNASTDEPVTSDFKTEEGDSLEDSIELTSTEKTAEISSLEYTYYESSVIDVSSVENGKVKVSVKVSDKAGNDVEKTETFSVDNRGPESVNITSPSMTDSLTGTVKIVGSAFDNSASESGIANIEWLIPLKGQKSMTKEALSALTAWTNDLQTGSAKAFRFSFTAGSEKGDLDQYEEKSGGVYKYDVEELKDDTGAHNGTYRIPIFFRTTDVLGNYYVYKDFYITHDPDGDRPVTTLSYPTENDYVTETVNGVSVSKGYITLAGVIRVNGTVNIPTVTEGVDIDKVYIQIGSVDESGKVTWSSSPAAGSALAKEFSTLGGVKTLSDLRSAYTTVSKAPSDWWGIETNRKSRTWNISLNSNEDLNSLDGIIAVRACSINTSGKMGTWTETVFIHVDASAPTQSGVVRKYKNFNENSPESNILSTKDFDADMYINGTAYLVVTMNDNDNLKELVVKKTGRDITADCTKGTVTYTYTDGTSDTETKDASKTLKSLTQKVYIPVDTSDIPYKTVTYTVIVADDKYSSTGTYSFNIDNKAPEFTALTGNESSLLVTSNIPAVKNSNYSYTLASTLKEEDSGFDKAFFYFLRDVNDAKTPRLLDVMIDSATDETNSYAAISTLDSFTIAQGINMYGKTYSGTLGKDSSDEARKSFTADGIGANNHIREGGLIYIGGEYQVITKKDGNKVEFADAVPEILEVTSADFPYGQVIDNSGESSGDMDTSTCTIPITGDDGDEMAETVKKDGSYYEIGGTVYSDRMTDGPVKIVVIAFDSVGNVSGKTISTSVANNAPRIAKLYLGTDLTGDEKYDENEFNEYTFASSKNGFIQDENYVQAVDFTTDSTSGTGNNYSDYKSGVDLS